MLQKWMEIKQEENRLKEERLALEDEIFKRFKPCCVKENNTLREGEYKITIKLNTKYKVTGEVPEKVDIYVKKVDDKKLKNYVGEAWVSEVNNKPSITIVKEV